MVLVLRLEAISEWNVDLHREWVQEREGGEGVCLMAEATTTTTQRRMLLGCLIVVLLKYISNMAFLFFFWGGGGFGGVCNYSPRPLLWLTCCVSYPVSPTLLHPHPIHGNSAH